MTNSEYWRKRMDAQAGSVYKRCDQFIEELMRQYQTAVRSMEADIAKWYQRFADANGITLAEAGRLLNSDELLEFQWTVEDYIRRGEENAVSGIWMKELESASARVHISRLDSLKMSLRQHVEELIGMQLKTLPEVLHATYRESYDRTVYELSRGSRVMLSYQKPDVRRIDRVLGTPWSSDGKEFSERVWGNRAQLIGSMNTHLTQSIIRGEDPQKAINAIAKDMNVSKRRAGTLVMTESAAIATAAQRDCYKDLDVEEFEYVCTLDEVTCPVCGAMDGKHFPMSKYEIGVNVPPMHPNCRCATAPYFDDMDDWGADRAARDENGKTVSVPANMTYEQWKKEQKKIVVETKTANPENLTERRKARQQERENKQNINLTERRKKRQKARKEAKAEKSISVNREKRNEFRGAGPGYNKRGQKIVFHDKISDETKDLVTKLSGEYETRLQTVTFGANKAAGDVNAASGSLMRLSTKQPTAVIHEYAHTIASDYADKIGTTQDHDFWKEIKKVRREYRKEVGDDSSRWISSYEHGLPKEIDEFFAEAFTHAYAKENGISLPDKYGSDFTFSNRVLEITKRYFGKSLE